MGEATTKTRRRSRKRCPHCSVLFWPDPRTPKQRACSAMECQKERRRETQSRWRAKNPADAKGRRYRQDVADAKERLASRPPDRPPDRPPNQPPDFPWEDVRAVIPPDMYVTIKYFARSWSRLMKDLMETQRVESKGDIGVSSCVAAKDLMETQRVESKGDIGVSSYAVVKDPIEVGGAPG